VKRKHEDDFLPDLIDGDEALDLVIDAMLIGNAGLRRLTKKILRAQKNLRRVVDDDAWRKYLKLEEAENARTEMQMQILVRWALGHGARSRR